MFIDARDMKLQELFIQLREIFASLVGKDVAIDISMGSLTDAQKAAAFATMSGCKTDIEKKEDFFIVHITGQVCCV